MKKLMINIDINSTLEPFLNQFADRESVREEELWPYVDPYAGAQVTDVLINSFTQFSQTPSKVFSDFAFKCAQTEENGVKVDYRTHFRGNTALHARFGIDAYDVWFRRLKQIGIRPWLSVRMNDCHCPEETACFLRPDYFYEARERGYMIGAHYGYYRYCYNYAVQEVREKFLAYIEEQLMRYDVYGIELDFMREIHCFDYVNDPECHTIMTAFLRDAKRVIDACGAHWGHKIYIAVRLMRDIAQNKVFGFDAETIVSEHLCDQIIVTPRWATCDSGMDVRAWKKLCEGTDIEVTAGLEILVNRQQEGAYATPEIVRGYAADYLGQGSDGIYLFNYYFFTDQMAKFQEIYRSCGTEETAVSLPRRHIMTYQDTAPEGTAPWKPLPAAADGRMLTVSVGKITEGTADLILGIPEGADCGALRVEVGGILLSGWEKTEQGRNYAPDQTALYRARIPEEALQKTLAVRLNSTEGTTMLSVSYLEVSVTPAPFADGD